MIIRQKAPHTPGVTGTPMCTTASRSGNGAASPQPFHVREAYRHGEDTFR